MKQLELKIWPETILKKRTNEVVDFDPVELNKTILEMYNLMQTQDGAGLAAPQVGLDMRLLVFTDYQNDKAESYMINPVILSSEGEITDWEGCLSFPGVTVKVKRAAKIKVEYQQSNGEVVSAEFEGFTARIIQHEIEHLDGKVFIQYLSGLKRDVVTRKMKKVRDRVQRQIQAARELQRAQLRS